MTTIHDCTELKKSGEDVLYSYFLLILLRAAGGKAKNRMDVITRKWSFWYKYNISVFTSSESQTNTLCKAYEMIIVLIMRYQTIKNDYLHDLTHNFQSFIKKNPKQQQLEIV